MVTDALFLEKQGVSVNPKTLEQKRRYVNVIFKISGIFSRLIPTRMSKSN